MGSKQHVLDYVDDIIILTNKKKCKRSCAKCVSRKIARLASIARFKLFIDLHLYLYTPIISVGRKKNNEKAKNLQ